MQNKSGTANNPIAIDDEQITNERELILEAARNKIIIQQAEFTSQPLDLCFAAAKISIGGDLPTKQRELNRAIISFFKKEIGINISCEHFERKIEPDYSNPDMIPNPCELLIYGVDFLTTKMIKDRFTLLQASIREIVWINDSTCKLIYSSAAEAELVVKDQAIKDTSSNSMKIEQESQALPRGWFPIKTYQIFSFQRLLWARYATLAEKNMEKSKKLAYQKFAMAKQELGKHLLTEFNAISKYKILVQDIQRKRYLEGRRPERNQRQSRTRQRNRDHSRFRRQFEGNRRQPNFRRDKYANTSFEMNEQRQVRYGQNANRPNNDSFAYGHQRNSNYNRDRDQNTSFKYERNMKNQTNQYLDYNGNSNNLNTSFNYNSKIRKNQSSNLNLSFRQQQTRRVCYDAPDESELSFNQFGSIRRPNNERDDFNCDFNQEERRSLYGNPDVGTSFVYNGQRPNQNEANTSFNYNPRANNRNNHNQSFNLDNGYQTKKDKMAESFLENRNPNDISKPSREEQDFFQRLNSVVSSVRQRNEQDLDDDQSFEYNQNAGQNNKKSNNILSESFDSY